MKIKAKHLTGFTELEYKPKPKKTESEIDAANFISKMNQIYDCGQKENSSSKQRYQWRNFKLKHYYKKKV